MNLISSFQLILLAAIWGGSFLFMRIAAQPLGPAYLIEARVFFAAITLLGFAIFLKRNLDWSKYQKHYFIIGFFNSALPFLLFAYAAQTLTVSTLSIINSTAPIWGTLIALFWFKTAVSVKTWIGIVFGIVGVVVLVGADISAAGNVNLFPLGAAMMASFSYGIASNYAKHAPQISSFNNSHGSMWASVIIVLPLLFFLPIREMPTIEVSSSVIALGVVCTALAYILYFKLIADLGATQALSVTFLIPLFGILWGYWVLGEQVTYRTLLGGTLVIIGTVLITNFRLNLRGRNKGKLNHA